MEHCVYTVSHPTGKFYIGKGNTAAVSAQRYKGSGKKLNLAFKKYPKTEWTAKVLHTFETAAEAYAREAELVTAETLANPLCMNLKFGGLGSPGLSDEARQVLREKNLGRKHTAETKAKISLNHRREQTPETREKMSACQVGKKKSADQIEKNRLSHLGKTASTETKAKMSETQKRVQNDPEHRAKQSKRITEWWAKRKGEHHRNFDI